MRLRSFPSLVIFVLPFWYKLYKLDLGAGNIAGKVTLGFMCDINYSRRFFIFSLTQFGMGAIISSLPFCHSYATLVLCAITFGYCFGNYATFPSLMAEYVGMDKLSEAMGYIVFLEGAAAIIGPPLAGKT